MTDLLPACRMAIASIAAHTVPAKLILALEAAHVRAATIFLDHDTAVGAWSGD